MSDRLRLNNASSLPTEFSFQIVIWNRRDMYFISLNRLYTWEKVVFEYTSCFLYCFYQDMVKRTEKALSQSGGRIVILNLILFACLLWEMFNCSTFEFHRQLWNIEKTAGITETYEWYFKCPVTKHLRPPVNACSMVLSIHWWFKSRKRRGFFWFVFLAVQENETNASRHPYSPVSWLL